VRVIIPIERGDDEEQHRRTIASLTELNRPILQVEPPLELHFPTLQDVDDHINADSIFKTLDEPTRAQCRRIYHEVEADPQRSLQLLGDRLNPILFGWETKD
jgi:hypothetical protein